MACGPSRSGLGALPEPAGVTIVFRGPAVYGSGSRRNSLLPQATAWAPRSETVVRGCGWPARAGKVVSTTQIVSRRGSAQARVPVEPPWPKVASEQPGCRPERRGRSRAPRASGRRSCDCRSSAGRCPAGPPCPRDGGTRRGTGPGRGPRRARRPTGPRALASRDCSNPTPGPTDRRPRIPARRLRPGIASCLPAGTGRAQAQSAPSPEAGRRFARPTRGTPCRTNSPAPVVGPCSVCRSTRRAPGSLAPVAGHRCNSPASRS
jgi:hypothetical protein